MSHAQELITAIQTCVPGRLRAVIEQLGRLSDDEVRHLPTKEQGWERKNYINDRLTGSLEITALHLAAKAYAAHSSDELLAAAFNEMVGDLLAAGASPWLEIGGRKYKQVVDGRVIVRITPGQTVAEVCEGRMPPALTAWLAATCDNTSTTKGSADKKHPSTLRQQKAKVAAFRKKREEREALAQGEQIEVVRHTKTPKLHSVAWR